MESSQNSNILVRKFPDYSIVISMGAVYSSSDKNEPSGSSRQVAPVTIRTNQPKPIKRPAKRTKYTPEQTGELESAFQENKYLTPQTRRDLSEACQLTELQIKVWFQNRRKKEQRRMKKEKEFEKKVNQYLLSLIQSTNAESFNDLVHFLDSSYCHLGNTNPCPHQYFHQTSLRCPCVGVAAERNETTTVDWGAIDGDTRFIIDKMI